MAITLKALLGALWRAHRDQRGQALILTAGLFTVVFVAGVIAVDFGLWWAERRDSQTDADAAVLAGVQDLPDQPLAANLNTEAWAMRNGVDLSEIVGITIDNSCFSDDPLDDPAVLDSVAIDVERNDNPLVFGEAFGLTAPNIGAHAKACVGSNLDFRGLRPWAIAQYHSECFEWDDANLIGVKENGEFAPLFGQECIIRLESPSSQVGSIRLGDDIGDLCNEVGGGAAKYTENIIEGSDAVCSVGEPVDTEPGLNVGPTLKALATLLLTEGECDTKYGPTLLSLNGIDDFPEALISSNGPEPTPSPDVSYSRRDCTSPRLVTIVIIDEFSKAAGFDTAIMRGFAGFWIYGCEELDKNGVILEERPKCDFTGGAGSSFQIIGVFINIQELEGNVRPLNPFGTRRIFLAE